MGCRPNADRRALTPAVLAPVIIRTSIGLWWLRRPSAAICRHLWHGRARRGSGWATEPPQPNGRHLAAPAARRPGLLGGRSVLGEEEIKGRAAEQLVGGVAEQRRHMPVDVGGP